jgi:ATP-dependent DNA ligase
MNRFAALIDRLATSSDAEMTRRLLTDYLATTPEPDRTIAADILSAKLKRPRVKLALIKGLAEARLDPELYSLSLNYVGDIAETIALLWPPRRRANRDPSLSEVIDALSTLGRSELPKRIEAWLDASDANGRWALIKLMTGTLKASLSIEDIDAALGREHSLFAPPPQDVQDEMFAVADNTSAGAAEAVLMYVEYGRSKTSPTTCTFGMWKDGALVPIGKADIAPGADAKRIVDFARDHTLNRFGPVREVAQTLVLQIGFEGLQRSPRHKSGIALRAPRIIGLRADMPPCEASTIDALERLLPGR